MQNFLITSIFFFTALISAVQSTRPKEYQVDKSAWQNPSDRHQSVTDYTKNSDEICDCDAIVHECQQDLIKSNTKLHQLSQTCSKHDQKLIKNFLSQILKNLKIDYRNSSAIFIPAHIHLSKEGMLKVKEFLESEQNSATLAEELEPILKGFVKHVTETKQSNWILGIIFQLPFAFEIGLTVVLYILFKIFKAKTLLIIFLVLLANEVNEKINQNYREAYAQRLSRQAQITTNPCAPKSWFYAIGTYFGSFVARIEDPCDTFYKDVLAETSVNFKVLSSSFIVIGKTMGAPLIGFFESLQEAIEVFLTPAPIHIQMAKITFVGMIMFILILLILKTLQIRIKTPVFEIDFRAGQNHPDVKKD